MNKTHTHTHINFAITPCILYCPVIYFFSLFLFLSIYIYICIYIYIYIYITYSNVFAYRIYHATLLFTHY